jgi:hypothetical protein
MTANEMADSLEQKLDRSNAFGSPGYEDDDLSSVLTEANHFYVKKYIDEVNNRKFQGFQETEIRNQGLGALIENAPSLTVSASQVGVLPNEKFFDLPTNHMYTIYEHCVIDKLVCGSEVNYIVADVIPKGYNEIRRLIDNKYQKPYYKSYGKARVWRTEYSRQTSGIVPSAPATPKRHGIFTDGTFNVTTYVMNYLRNPSAITVDRNTPNNQRNCELDISTHTVIVDIACDLMLQRVKEQKLQIIEPFKELE